MPFGANVNTSCQWADLENQVRNKVNEIADDQGRNSHGQVTFNNGTTCQHWRAGSYRIFGNYDGNAGQFNFIGWGRHVGRGDSSYRVELCGGGRTRATTS